MSTDLTADLAAFAADVQTRAAALADQIRDNAKGGDLPHEYVSYLNLAAGMIADTARQVGRDGLYFTPEPADLDTADPTIDVLLRQLVKVGA
jgi:hypothetical protein